jgi:hypothetical protein
MDNGKIEKYLNERRISNIFALRDSNFSILNFHFSIEVKVITGLKPTIGFASVNFFVLWLRIS